MSVPKLSLILTLLLALAVVSAFPAKARTIDEQYAINFFTLMIYGSEDPEVSYASERDSLSHDELEELLPLLEDVRQLASERYWPRSEEPAPEDLPYFMHRPGPMDMRYMDLAIAEVRDMLDALIYDVIIDGRASRADWISTVIWLYLEDDDGREYHAYNALCTLGPPAFARDYDATDRMRFWLRQNHFFNDETWLIVKQQMLAPGYYQDVDQIDFYDAR